MFLWRCRAGSTRCAGQGGLGVKSGGVNEKKHGTTEPLSEDGNIRTVARFFSLSHSADTHIAGQSLTNKELAN